MHWPICALSDSGQFQHKELEQGWREMEECVRKGYTRHIGVSNYNLAAVMEMLTWCRIKPAVNQVECHPYNFNASLVEGCQKLGVQVMAYCPLARGLASPLESSLLKEDVIEDIASKHGRTPAQVVLRFLSLRNVVAIPKTSSPARLQENFESWSLELTEDDLKKIRGLSKGQRVVNPKSRPMYSFMPLFD